MAKHPAAHINVLAEEGTRDELVRDIASKWDEICELRKERRTRAVQYERAEHDFHRIRKDLEAKLRTIREELNDVLVRNQDGKTSNTDAMSELHELFHQWFQR